MRVTSNSYSDNLINDLQRLNSRMSTLQTQAATGQRISQPSDDPAAAVRVLNFQAERSRLAQYQRNAQHAQDIVNASIAQVQNMLNVSDRANEIIALTTEVLGDAAMTTYATEIDELLEQALVDANAYFNDEPLFGGTTGGDPFAATYDANGHITSVTYVGSSTTAELQVSEGSRLSPYTDEATNLQVRDFLNNLVALRDRLQTGDAASVKDLGDELQTSEDALIVTLSGRGALQHRLEIETAQNNSRYSALAIQISRDADADLAQTVVELTQTQNAYQAALMSAGKVLEKSLLDYI